MIDLSPGRTLGDRFVLIRRLAEAGSTQVWLAEDREREQRVALKCVDAERFTAAGVEARLQAEMERAQSLPAELAVNVLGLYRADGLALLAMEYLPGGDLGGWIGAAVRPDSDFERFVQALARRYPQLPAGLVRRLARGYGARVDRVIGAGALGAEVAPGLFEAELDYLYRREWARCADDVLWRRTKLGLHLGAAQREQVQAWCKAHWPPQGKETSWS